MVIEIGGDIGGDGSKGIEGSEDDEYENTRYERCDL